MKISKNTKLSGVLFFSLAFSMAFSSALADPPAGRVKEGTFNPDQVFISVMKESGDDSAWVKVELPDGEFHEPPQTFAEAKEKAKTLYALVQSCQKKRHMIDFFEIDGKWSDLEDSGKAIP